MKPTLNRFFRIFATVVACVCATVLPHAALAAQSGMLLPSAAKEVPDVGYVDVEGNRSMLAEHKGKVVVLHFWAKWCPPCVEELPQMQKALAELEAGGDLVVLPLSLDRTPETIRAFYAANDITLPLLLDDKGKAMRALEIRGLPSTIILNREGKEIARRAGVVDWESEAVKGVIQDALSAE